MDLIREKIIGEPVEIRLSEVINNKTDDLSFYIQPVHLILDDIDVPYSRIARIIKGLNLIEITNESYKRKLTLRQNLRLFNINNKFFISRVKNLFSKINNKNDLLLMRLRNNSYKSSGEIVDISNNKFSFLNSENILTYDEYTSAEKEFPKGQIFINTTSEDEYVELSKLITKGETLLFNMYVLNITQEMKLFKKEISYMVADEKYKFEENGMFVNAMGQKFDYRRLHAYVYDFGFVEGRYYIKLFVNGYNPFHEKFHGVLGIEEGRCTVEVNDDYKYYSEFSINYPCNFYTYTFDELPETVTFTSGERRIRLSYSKYAQKVKNVHEKEVFKRKGSMAFKSLDFEYADVDVKEPIMIFIDRSSKADDSAEVLYRHVKENKLFPKCAKYFIVEEASADFARLKEEGFNVVDFNSSLYKKLYYNASYLISTHAGDRIINPFFEKNRYYVPKKCKFIFLQHGVIMHNHQPFLSRTNLHIDLFVTSGEREKQNIERFSGYDNVVVTGLPRFSNYKNRSEKIKKIVYSPSWNVNYLTNFKTSKYYNALVEVISNPELLELLAENNIEFDLVLHPELSQFSDLFPQVKNIGVKPATSIRYSEVLNTCDILITDYSSILFDILYQQKKVISYAPYELHHENDELKIHKELMVQVDNIDSLIAEIKQSLKHGHPKYNSDTYSQIFGAQNPNERVCNEIEKIGAKC